MADTIECKKIKFSGHAVQRMFERKLSKQAVKEVIKTGETIAEYPDDTPYPSYLMLGFVDEIPLHAVVAFDKRNKSCYVITAYVPDLKQWHGDYKTRRKR